MENSNLPTYIDLFAGCGGISLGLSRSGWKGLFVIEKSDMAFKTLKYNLIDNNHFDWPDWLPVTEHDINNVLIQYRNELIKLQGKVDLITGGPPCQGFSFAGRRNRNDERNALVDAYIKFISLIQPRFIFLENVKGFTVGFKNEDYRDDAYSEYVKRELEALGYSVKCKIVNFSEYGVPQNRERFILFGDLYDCPEIFFELTAVFKVTYLLKKGIKDFTTLKEAISDLKKEHGVINSNEFKTFMEGVYGKPESNYQKLMRSDLYSEKPDSHRFTNHRIKTSERLQYIIDNCLKGVDISIDIKKKFNLNKHTIIPLDQNLPSATLTTLPDDYIHYSEPRILTVREYARIQSFPDNFIFKSNYTSGGKNRKVEIPRYTQVGNAVPPIYTELSGIVIKEMI